MGIAPFSRHRCDCKQPVPLPLDHPAARPPNPDPRNWNLVKRKVISGPAGTLTVLMIQYPDCTNFEGVKVMVYEGRFDPRLYVTLDPHFTDDGCPSPIARFAPTGTGWENALSFARMLVTRKD